MDLALNISNHLILGRRTLIVKSHFTFGCKVYFSFILYHSHFQTALYDWKLDLWVCGFLLLELVCVLSEMDVSEEAQAGPVSAEK